MYFKCIGLLLINLVLSSILNDTNECVYVFVIIFINKYHLVLYVYYRNYPCTTLLPLHCVHLLSCQTLRR